MDLCQGHDENLNDCLKTPPCTYRGCLSSPPRFKIKSYCYNDFHQECTKRMRLLPIRTHDFDDGKMDYIPEKQCTTSNTDEKNRHDEQMNSAYRVINKLSFPLLLAVNGDNNPLCTSDKASIPRHLLIPELSSQASCSYEYDNLHYEKKHYRCSKSNNDSSCRRSTSQRRMKLKLRSRQSRSPLHISTPIFLAATKSKVQIEAGIEEVPQ